VHNVDVADVSERALLGTVEWLHTALRPGGLVMMLMFAIVGVVTWALAAVFAWALLAAASSSDRRRLQASPDRELVRRGCRDAPRRRHA
jgi:hypothetical protein